MVSETKLTCESVGKTDDCIISEASKRPGPSDMPATKSSIHRVLRKMGMIVRRYKGSSFSHQSSGSEDEHETNQKITGSTLATVHDDSITSNDSSTASAPFHEEGYQDPSTATMAKSSPRMRFEKLYELKNVLGVGAYSIVREGFHRKSNKNKGRFQLDKSVGYAIKCIDREKMLEAEERALVDEVSILRQLEHPNVIRLVDVFDEPTKYYLVMERVYGGELFDRICSKSYYDEVEARECCIGLLHGMVYLHDNHIVHRDLKPENVLLSTSHDDVSVKIADFGFAKRCPRQCYLTSLCGTPGYVAPEVPMGWPYDERVDMWSLGVMLYILLCGYPPFIETDQGQLFGKIIKGDYELHEEYWDTVSYEAKDLVKSLMNVDRESRLTADGALRENLWILGDCEQLERIRVARLPSSPQDSYYSAVESSYSSSKLSPHREALRPAGGILRGHQNKQQAHQHHKQHNIGATTAAVPSITEQIIKKMPTDYQQEQSHKHDAGPTAVTITNKLVKRMPAAIAA